MEGERKNMSPTLYTEPVFLNVYWAQESIINSASLCSLVGRYDNPIPTWFPAPIDSLKIPAQYSMFERQHVSLQFRRRDHSTYRAILRMKAYYFSSL